MSRTLRRESKTSRLRHTGTSPGNLVFGKRHPMKDWRMAAGYVFPMPVPYQLTAYLVYPHGKKHTHRIDGKQQTHRTKLRPSRDKSSHDRVALNARIKIGIPRSRVSRQTLLAHAKNKGIDKAFITSRRPKPVTGFRERSGDRCEPPRGGCFVGGFRRGMSAELTNDLRYGWGHPAAS